MTIADAGCGEREPESVGAAGAADGKVSLAGLADGFFERADLRAKNKALGPTDVSDCAQNLLAEIAILAGEVEKRDWLCGNGGTHTFMVHGARDF